MSRLPAERRNHTISSMTTAPRARVPRFILGLRNGTNVIDTQTDPLLRNIVDPVASTHVGCREYVP